MSSGIERKPEQDVLQTPKEVQFQDYETKLKCSRTQAYVLKRTAFPEQPSRNKTVEYLNTITINE